MSFVSISFPDFLSYFTGFLYKPKLPEVTVAIALTEMNSENPPGVISRTSSHPDLIDITKISMDAGARGSLPSENNLEQRVAEIGEFKAPEEVINLDTGAVLTQDEKDDLQKSLIIPREDASRTIAKIDEMITNSDQLTASVLIEKLEGLKKMILERREEVPEDEEADLVVDVTNFMRAIPPQAPPLPTFVSAIPGQLIRRSSPQNIPSIPMAKPVHNSSFDEVVKGIVAQKAKLKKVNSEEWEDLPHISPVGSPQDEIAAQLRRVLDDRFKYINDSDSDVEELSYDSQSEESMASKEILDIINVYEEY